MLTDDEKRELIERSAFPNSTPLREQADKPALAETVELAAVVAAPFGADAESSPRGVAAIVWPVDDSLETHISDVTSSVEKGGA